MKPRRSSVRRTKAAAPLLSRLSVGGKLLVLVLLPVAVVLAVATSSAFDRWRQAQDLRAYTERLALSAQAVKLVDAVAAERVAAVGMTGRAGSQAVLRRATDRRIDILQARLQASGARDAAGRLEGHRRQLETARLTLDAGGADPSEAATTTSDVVRNLALFVRSLHARGPTERAREAATANLALLGALEAARREQVDVWTAARDTAGSEAGLVAPSRWAALEAAAFDEARQWTRPRLASEVDAVLYRPAGIQVRTLRAVLTSGVGRPGSARALRWADGWRDATQARIGDLRAVSRAATREQEDVVARDLSAANARLLITAVLSAGLLALVTALGLALRQSITRPLTEVAAAAQSLSEGDLDREVAYAGRDEIGHVASSFREVQSTAASVADEVAEINRAVVERDLTHRARATGLHGVWAELVSGLDATMGAFARLHFATEREAARQEALSALWRKVLEGIDVQDLYVRAADLVMEHTDATRCELYERANGAWVCRTSSGLPSRPVQLPLPEREAVTRAPVHSDAAVAVLRAVGDPDAPIGAILAEASDPEAFGPDDALFLDSVARLVTEVVHRRRTEQETRHRALHDPLTGLPNRLMLAEHLERALARARRSDYGVAVLFLDIDRFKLVNDSLGHGAGDQLLIDVADRLGASIRGGDVIARLGGDEFVIATEGFVGPLATPMLAERALACFEEPFDVGGQPHYARASIGIASTADGSVCPEVLLREADTAMYRAKHSGGGRAEHFDGPLRTEVVRRLAVEHRLRVAAEEHAIAAHFQPIVELRTDRVVAFEALSRWHDEELGAVSPAEFIPVAEETNLIRTIGLEVFRQSCQAVAQHRVTTDRATRPVRVAVNVSVAQLSDVDFVPRIAQIRQSFGLRPSDVYLEITESALLEEAPSVLASLAQLHGEGVPLAIDDFGTGYSSFSYLTRFPVSILKIDRAFVQELGRAQEHTVVVAAMIDMAHHLGIRVVAEGVETDVQAEILRGLGCDLAQGFLYGRGAPEPLPAANAVGSPG
ncbi:MAG: EAL domain-containing protein [Baekduiaceae bacterium]